MSAIPKLGRTHILRALASIDRDGVPPKRQATRYHLVFESNCYPPKYVISLASLNATGRELQPHEFSGGEESNAVLRSLGFEIQGPAPPLESKPSPPTILRIVVRGKPATSTQTASELLIEAFEQWTPHSGPALIALTPGGFVSGDLPDEWRGGIGWDSTKRDLRILQEIALPIVDETLTQKVLRAAKSVCHFLTIGVDLFFPDGPHAELVALVDVHSGDIVRWTGKSYPTGDQETKLIQVADLSSHCLKIAGERVLVLGCHDLNMFSQRAYTNQSADGVRRKRCDAMHELVSRFRPTIVLQHPHSTDSPNIWRMPWACLARDYPSVQTYASGIAYYNGRGDRPRQKLGDALSGTRSDDGVADLIVKSR